MATERTMEEILQEVEKKGWVLSNLSCCGANFQYSCILERGKKDNNGFGVFAASDLCATPKEALSAPPGPKPSDAQLLLLGWMLDIPMASAKQHRLLKRLLKSSSGTALSTVSVFKWPSRIVSPRERASALRLSYDRRSGGGHSRHPQDGMAAR
jgi:hypothetical protein